MKCSFCGKSFDEMRAREKCRNCALFGGCRNLKCPHCGYEMPEEPGFVKWIRKKTGKEEETNDHPDQT